MKEPPISLRIFSVIFGARVIVVEGTTFGSDLFQELVPHRQLDVRQYLYSQELQGQQTAEPRTAGELKRCQHKEIPRGTQCVGTAVTVG